MRSSKELNEKNKVQKFFFFKHLFIKLFLTTIDPQLKEIMDSFHRIDSSLWSKAKTVHGLFMLQLFLVSAYGSRLICSTSMIVNRRIHFSENPSKRGVAYSTQDSLRG